MRQLPVLLMAMGLVACGGGDEGEPLLAGSMTGEWDGTSFTPAFGFATTYMDTPLIIVGDGPVHCGSENANSPPSGTNAAMYPDAFTVGEYTSVFVELHRNVGDYEGIGSNVGTVSITAVSETSIAGSVSYDYTDDEQRHFAISGTFEVLNCAP